MDNQIYGLTTGQTSPTSRIRHEDEKHAPAEHRGVESNFAGPGRAGTFIAPVTRRAEAATH